MLFWKKSGHRVKNGLGTLEGWDLFRARLGLVEKNAANRF
jgi:hypothetical protein